MTRRAAAVLLALACCWPPAAAQDGGDAAKELARLEGAWRVEGLQVDRKSVRLQASDATFTFSGGAFSSRLPGFGKAAGKVAVGSGRIDLLSVRGPSLHGAYRFDRGTLTLALWTRAGDRQDALDPTEQDPPGMVFTLRRPQKGEVGTGG
jgi:hypothetical protein